MIASRPRSAARVTGSINVGPFGAAVNPQPATRRGSVDWHLCVVRSFCSNRQLRPCRASRRQCDTRPPDSKHRCRPDQRRSHLLDDIVPLASASNSGNVIVRRSKNSTPSRPKRMGQGFLHRRSYFAQADSEQSNDLSERSSSDEVLVGSRNPVLVIINAIYEQLRGLPNTSSIARLTTLFESKRASTGFERPLALSATSTKICRALD